MSAGKTVYELFPDLDKQRERGNFPDIEEPFFWQTLEKCKPYSLLGAEAFYNLFCATEYIARCKIPGDFVECGVYLGGTVLALSHFAFHWGLTDRKFYLYDTFDGFPAGITEVNIRGETVKFRSGASFLEQTRAVIAESPFPREQFEFVPGPVEQTLRRIAPEKIALLRLDTDYYESTRVELSELYPRLAAGGVLVVDDYGCFRGARRATDEFIAQQQPNLLLLRVNFSVRSGVKIG